MKDNPYQAPSPQTGLPRGDGPKLYSYWQVLVATLLSSCLGGGFLMWTNYRRVGRPAEATRALVIGAIVTVAIIVLAMVLPEDFPTTPFWVGQICGMHAWYRRTQQELFDSHMAGGGSKESIWKAVGWGLLATLCTVCIGVVIALVMPEAWI